MPWRYLLDCTDFKLAIAGGTGLLAILAQSMDDLKPWEEVSLKAVLMGALIFGGKLFLQQQREHKKEIAETWAQHKKEIAQHKEESVVREQKVVGALEANTRELSGLRAVTEEQTTYFKTVTRNLVEERLKGTKPTLP